MVSTEGGGVTRGRFLLGFTGVFAAYAALVAISAAR